MKTISILGATGSIGVNTLSIVREAQGAFKIAALAAGKNISLLAEQMGEFTPEFVAVIDDAHANALKKLIGRGFSGDILCGAQGYQEVATTADAKMVVSAMVGAAGLKPTIAAIKAGKDIALANKEVLVMAGQIVMNLASEHNIRILPVDSEHSAILQCLNGEDKKSLRRLILTASGGPFLHHFPAALENIAPAAALQHPKWSMGKKISVDSATMMNKGLELIEARWLFDVDSDHLSALVHPQSIVHSLVEFCDGALMAQLALPDMRLPIAYALNYPQRLPLQHPRLDLCAMGALEFYPPDLQKFPCLALALAALASGGLLPAALNAANEAATTMFLEGQLKFTQIHRLIAAVVAGIENKQNPTLEEILAIDTIARDRATAALKGMQ